MATDDRNEEVKSYLGHPCSIAPLLRAREGWKDFDEMRTADPRALAQRLCKILGDLQERAEYSHRALEQLHAMASTLEDTDAMEAFAAVLAEYATRTANIVFDVGSHALAALERAGMIEASQKGATHG